VVKKYIYNPFLKFQKLVFCSVSTLNPVCDTLPWINSDSFHFAIFNHTISLTTLQTSASSSFSSVSPVFPLFWIQPFFWFLQNFDFWRNSRTGLWFSVKWVSSKFLDFSEFFVEFVFIILEECCCWWWMILWPKRILLMALWISLWMWLLWIVKRLKIMWMEKMIVIPILCWRHSLKEEEWLESWIRHVGECSGLIPLETSLLRCWNMNQGKFLSVPLQFTAKVIVCFWYMLKL